MALVFRTLGILFVISIVMGCSSFSDSELRAKDKPLHHTKDGFRNYPIIEKADVQRFRLIWNRIFTSSENDQIPKDHVISEREAVTSLRGLKDTDTVTWIGQSTTLIRLNGKTILTDPCFAESVGPGGFGVNRTVPPGISAKNLPKIDFIIVSHNHYDHLDADFIESLPNKQEIQIVVPLKLGEFFTDKGYVKIHELDWHQSVTIEGIQFNAHPMVHYSNRGLFDKNETLWCSWSILSSDLKLIFVGDTAFSPTIFKEIGAEMGGYDYALLPIGTYGNRIYGVNNHVNPKEAFQIGLDLLARTMIPIHWGTIDLSEEPLFEPPELFKEVAKERGFDQNNLWIMKIGETRVLE